MKSLPLSILAFFLLGLAIRPALALTEGACLKDEQKFCKGLPVAEVKQCMEKHLEQLSDACKTNILEMMMKEKKKQQAGN